LLLANWKLDFKESTFSCTVSVGTTGSVDCEQNVVFLKLIKEKPFKLDCNVYTVLSSPAFLMVDIKIIVNLIIIITISLGKLIYSKCRICCKEDERIKHSVAGSTTLAASVNTNRHNKAAGYSHWTIYKHVGLQVTEKYC
jgi:hypothetical protein